MSGNASTATSLATARTITLAGDVAGSVSFDGSANVSMTVAVADDSHNHIISNVDGLQTALDTKVSTTGTGATGSWGISVTGSSASTTGNAATATRLATARTITLAGDVSGSVSFDGSDNVSMTVAVDDDSHNHIIANVDGLQTALDAKAPLASPALTGTPTAPTAAVGTNTTQLATTAFVQAASGYTANTFTSSGTWTKPAGTPANAMIRVEMWGGGGGGCRIGSDNFAGGGGGGAFSTYTFLASEVGSTVSVTVGAGGNGRATSTGNGGNGGSSSFGSLITAYGGGGGLQNNNGAANGGGGGGQLSAGSGATQGSFGGDMYGGGMGGGPSSDTVGSQNSVYGGGGGGGCYTPTPTFQTGGTSKFAGNGGRSASGVAGADGQIPAGGGGCGVNQNGGDGARGEVRVWVIY